MRALQDVTFVSLVFDHWSDRCMNSYLGLMITTYDETCDALTPFLLQMPISKSHTSGSIKEQVMEIVSSYLGLRGVVVGISTDNAANMMKVARECYHDNQFGKQLLGHVPCLLNSTNVISSTLFEPSEMEEAKFREDIECINAFIESKEMKKYALKYQLQENGTRGETPFSEPLMDFLTSHNIDENVLCFLSGDKILQKNNELTTELKFSILKMELYNIECKKFDKVHAGKGLKLKSYCRTRWVSAIETLNRLLVLEPVLLSLSERKCIGVIFTKTDFEIAKDLLALLEPFQVLCATLSNDNCTVKFIIPLLQHYKLLMEKNSVRHLKSNYYNMKHVKHLTQFTNKMEKYYKKYSENEICIVASFLCIEFMNSKFWSVKYPGRGRDGKKRTFVANELSKKISKILLPYLKIYYEESEDVNEATVDPDSSFTEMDGHKSSSYEPKLPNDDSTLYDTQEDDKQCQSISSDLEDLIFNEILLYYELAIKEYHNCVDKFADDKELTKTPHYKWICKTIVGSDNIFWRDFGAELPLLSFTNRILRNIPATSIHVERLFSAASRLSERRKHQLSPKMLEKLCILKSFTAKISIEHIDLTRCGIKRGLALTKKLYDSTTL